MRGRSRPHQSELRPCEEDVIRIGWLNLDTLLCEGQLVEASVDDQANVHKEMDVVLNFEEYVFTPILAFNHDGQFDNAGLAGQLAMFLALVPSLRPVHPHVCPLSCPRLG